ncbi:MAG: helix-turn-helix transcriptional regulator [Elainellaceae cyanobacterium]
MRLTPKSRVAELREQAGLTQVQLAALVGVTPNTIQNWEKPDGLSQLERYLKLAEVFGCNVPDLVEYVEVPEETSSKTKGFSLQELRELRERWGTGTKAEPHKPELDNTDGLDTQESEITNIVSGGTRDR